MQELIIHNEFSLFRGNGGNSRAKMLFIADKISGTPICIIS